MPYSALSPVSTAIYGALNVAALTALAPGGVFEDVAHGTVFPFVWYEVQEAQQFGGLGTKPGTKMLPEMVVRVHVYSQYEGLREAQVAIAKVIELLKDPPVVTGYGSWAIFHDSTVPLPDEMLNGVKVKELVANFRLYVEEV